MGHVLKQISCYFYFQREKFIANAVPTIFDVPNPPRSLMPSRKPPAKRVLSPPPQIITVPIDLLRGAAHGAQPGAQTTGAGSSRSCTSGQNLASTSTESVAGMRKG